MSTCRDVIASAFGLLGVAGPGEAATADELDLGLGALSTVVLELHESRGALRDLDVAADVVAGEDQRLRIAPGVQISVTLPNSVPVDGRLQSSQGSILAADGVSRRAPRDGARVEIVGTSQQLFFYRADINAWQAAAPLSLDGPGPLNARYDGALAALVAERLLGPLGLPPDPALVARLARANATLRLRTGTARGPLRIATL